MYCICKYIVFSPVRTFSKVGPGSGQRGPGSGQRGPGSGTIVKAILYTKELYCITIITVRGILIHEVNNERNWFTTLSRLSKFASEYLRKVKKFAKPF